MDSERFFIEEEGLYTALCNHCVGNLHKATDICTLHVVYIATLLGAVLHAHLVDILHNRMKFLINLLLSPLDTHRVLRHLQARSCNTSGIRCLTWCVENFILEEDIDSLRCRWHICTLCNTLTAIIDKHLSLLTIQLVLSKDGYETAPQAGLSFRQAGRQGLWPL